MANAPFDPVIEKYRMELLEFSRKNPKFTDPAPREDAMPREEAVPQEETEQQERSNTTEDTLPPERIVPQQGLYRADFPQSAGEMRYQQRLQNVFAREGTAVPGTQQQSVSESKTAILPQAQRDDCNEQEHAYELEADKYPPFCNGTVEQFASEEEFLKKNPEIGYLRVQVFAANQSYPVQNAGVEVSKRFGDQKHVFFKAQTDASGIMTRIALPAPDRELADAPSALQPYATYEISVTHPGFAPVNLRDCAVFDRIETIQFAQMTPLLADDHPDQPELQEE